MSARDKQSSLDSGTRGALAWRGVADAPCSAQGALLRSKSRRDENADNHAKEIRYRGWTGWKAPLRSTDVGRKAPHSPMKPRVKLSPPSILLQVTYLPHLPLPLHRLPSALHRLFFFSHTGRDRQRHLASPPGLRITVRLIRDASAKSQSPCPGLYSSPRRLHCPASRSLTLPAFLNLLLLFITHWHPPFTSLPFYPAATCFRLIQHCQPAPAHTLSSSKPEPRTPLLARHNW